MRAHDPAESASFGMHLWGIGVDPKDYLLYVEADMHYDFPTIAFGWELIENQYQQWCIDNESQPPTPVEDMPL